MKLDLQMFGGRGGKSGSGTGGRKRSMTQSELTEEVKKARENGRQDLSSLVAKLERVPDGDRLKTPWELRHYTAWHIYEKRGDGWVAWVDHGHGDIIQHGTQSSLAVAKYITSVLDKYQYEKKKRK